VLGASVIAPAVRQPARAPAALRIAAVVANGAPVAMEGARATIPPGRRDLELRWALPAFASSRHVRFRYRLVGQDAAWLDAGARRAAFYTNLAPGAYAFEVRATHEEAGWTTAATLVTLELAPHLHERAAFRFGLAACALAAVALALRARRRGERARFAAILDERNRIARDMHDSLAQSFTALTLHLGRIDKKLPDVAPDVRTLVADARQMVSHCRREVRQAVFDLRHEGTELRAALETLATQAARASEEVAVRVVVEGEPRALPGAIEREVLYVAQEALSNALAHARACEVELRLRYADGAVELDVRDDGVGLPARAGSAGGFGLLGMRERARRVGGSLDFTSAPGQGTIVRMRVPS
jgi:signal transduction histidine kinase